MNDLQHHHLCPFFEHSALGEFHLLSLSLENQSGEHSQHFALETGTIFPESWQVRNISGFFSPAQGNSDNSHRVALLWSS